jgi:hypothetical protein
MDIARRLLSCDMHGERAPAAPWLQTQALVSPVESVTGRIVIVKIAEKIFCDEVELPAILQDHDVMQMP